MTTHLSHEGREALALRQEPDHLQPVMGAMAVEKATGETTESHAELIYDNWSDQTLYEDIDVQVGKEKPGHWNVAVGTVPGSPERPNEDAFAVTVGPNSLHAAVFDGTTNLDPIPSLGDESGAHFASHYLKDIFHDIETDAEPAVILSRLNQALLERSLTFEGATLENTHSLPASTGTIVKVNPDEKSLGFAHIGDSYAIAYYNDGHSELLTHNTNAPFDKRLFDLIDAISKERNITHREAQADPRVRELLIPMFIEKNNNPNRQGSGIINGDPHMDLYIQSGRLSLAGVDTLLLGTDGLVPQGWSLHNPTDRQGLLDEIRAGGVERLMATKHLSEDEDPDWQNIRYKHSDDATAVVVTQR